MKIQKITVLIILIVTTSPLLAQDSLPIQYIDLDHDNNIPFSREGVELNTCIFEGINSHELKPIKFDSDNTQHIDSLSYRGWEESISTDITNLEQNNIGGNHYYSINNNNTISTFRPTDLYSIVIDTRKSSNGINTKYIHFYLPGRHPENITGINIYTFSLDWHQVISYLKSNQNTYLFYENTYASWWKGNIILSDPHQNCPITLDLVSLNKKGLTLKNYSTGKSENLDSILKQTKEDCLSVLVYRKNNQLKKIAFDFDIYNYQKPVSDHIILSTNWNNLKKIMEQESLNKPMIKPMHRALLDNDFYADSTKSISKKFAQKKEVDQSEQNNHLYSFSETGTIYFNVKDIQKNNKSLTTLLSFINEQILTEKLPVYSTEKTKEEIPVDELKRIAYLNKWGIKEDEISESIVADDGWGNSWEQEKPLEVKHWEKESYWKGNNYNLFRLDTLPMPLVEIDNKIVFNDQGEIKSILLTNLTIRLPFSHPNNTTPFDLALFTIKWEDISILMRESNDKKIKHLYKDLVNSNFTKELHLTTTPLVYE